MCNSTCALHNSNDTMMPNAILLLQYARYEEVQLNNNPTITYYKVTNMYVATHTHYYFLYLGGIIE